MNRIIKNIYYHTPWLLSDRKYVELQWKLITGQDLNLDNPLTFNEKMQWLKVYDHRADYKNLADKVSAKDFAASVIGAEHIIPTLAVYKKASDIKWDELPNEFVLKCSHDSGGIVICRDKNILDKKAAEEFLANNLKKNFFYLAREWCYKGIKPRIICEKLMSDSIQTKSLIDYKFFCFNGIPKFLYISEGLENHKTATMSFVDIDGKVLPFHRTDFGTLANPSLPLNFSLMKELAGKLATAVNNRFIRVDLYEIAGTVYFSEFTFYPNGGHIPFEPNEWDRTIGDMIQL